MFTKLDDDRCARDCWRRSRSPSLAAIYGVDSSIFVDCLDGKDAKPNVRGGSEGIL